MLQTLLLIASALVADVSAVQPSKNGEFIFSKYPPRALARGEQGVVRFRADADAKGNVLSCQVTVSSGFPRLDAETCELIVNHASFAPAIDAGAKARAATHDGLVNWRIPGATAAVASQAVASNSAVPAKIICRRIEKTGSLVARSRLCLTQRDWDRYAEQVQDEWGDLQGRKGHTNSLPGQDP